MKTAERLQTKQCDCCHSNVETLIDFKGHLDDESQKLCTFCYEQYNSERDDDQRLNLYWDYSLRGVHASDVNVQDCFERDIQTNVNVDEL